MVSVSIDKAKAKAVLELAWSKASLNNSKLDPRIKKLIESVFEGKTLGYRYIVVTAILAKLSNRNANARALQKSSSIKGAYDARSLCHKVIVIFEHSKGNMWGLSKEPFLSKPLRHKEHDKNNPQLRDKLGAGHTQDILDWANNAKNDELFGALVLIMQLGISQLKTIPKAKIGSGKNLEIVRQFIRKFLSGPSDGGSRLVAVVAAFLKDFNCNSEVNVYNPNMSDTFSKTSGDIEIIFNKKVISSFECKDRYFGEDDIETGVKKAISAAVNEYIFVSGFHSKKIRYDFNKISRKTNIDIFAIHLPEAFDSWVVALSSNKRAEFGNDVVNNLNLMRKSDVARAAKATWDECLHKFR